MRLKLSLRSGREKNSPEQESYVFGLRGGTFGRSPSCSWVLSDPRRLISGVHGRIVFQDDVFLLFDESTNGIFINGAAQPLGRGHSIKLTDGMILMVGRKIIEARIEKTHHAAPRSSASEREQASPLLPTKGASESSLLDPVAYLSKNSLGAGQKSTPATVIDPFVSLGLKTSPHASNPVGAAVSPTASSSPRPLSERGAPLPPSEKAQPSRVSQALAAFPTRSPSPPSSAPGALKRIPDDFDPLNSLGKAKTSALPVPSAFMAPIERTFPEQSLSSPVRMSRPILNDRLRADIVCLESESKPPSTLGIGSLAASMEDGRQSSPVLSRQRTEDHHKGYEAYGKARSAIRAGEQPNVSGHSPNSISLKPLFDGLGFPNAHLNAETEAQYLREIGAMLRVTAEGLMQILAARRLVKSEFHLEEAHIKPEENNPFKFFKIPELALDELLIAPQGGFLPPAEATNEAFEDIKQHQMVMLAAMRNVVRLMLERLAPENVSPKKGEERSGMTAAKRNNWSAYIDIHERLSRNIDTLTHEIISAAFAETYDKIARDQDKQKGN